MVQLATTNISIIADANMESNPAYVQMESNPACSNIMNTHGEQFSTCKNPGDPAYHTIQIDDAHRDEYDYYY